MCGGTGTGSDIKEKFERVHWRIISGEKIDDNHHKFMDYLKSCGSYISSSPVTYYIPKYIITLQLNYSDKKVYIRAFGDRKKVGKFEKIIQKELKKFKESY